MNELRLKRLIHKTQKPTATAMDQTGGKCKSKPWYPLYQQTHPLQRQRTKLGVSASLIMQCRSSPNRAILQRIRANYIVQENIPVLDLNLAVMGGVVPHTNERTHNRMLYSRVVYIKIHTQRNHIYVYDSEP